MMNMLTTNGRKGTLRNCPVCGKLYTDTGAGVCPKCYDKLRDYENQIKEFVKTHPHGTVREIVRETKVPLRYASKMIRTGQFIAGGKISYPCSRCGKAITSGLYCSECMALVQKAAITAKKLEAERKAKEEQERIKKKFAEKKSSGLNILKILRGK